MALHLQDLKKRYVAPDGSIVPVIDLPDFSLADGEQVALIGSSGSGKSTLLHLIAGILSPDSGEVIFDFSGKGLAANRPTGTSTLNYRGPVGTEQVSLGRFSEAQRDVFRGANIGYIFQTHHLLPGFTALENVLLGMTFTGRKSDPAWATHLLTEVGLKDRLHYRPGKLSIGQQQRIAVARALANRPKVVLADEPTGALDPVNAQQVLDLIRKLCHEVNASLLLVTHDLSIANQMDRQVVLKDVNLKSQRAVDSGQGSVVSI